MVSHILTAGALTSLDASYVTTGVFSTARLGSGSADNTKFLRGDSTWALAVISVGLAVPPELSVSGSPVTSSGTLSVTKANQSANTVWAGPSAGSAAAPTFRALVTADYPDDSVTYAKMQNVSATSRILGRKTSGAGDVEECTLSEILDFISSATKGDILCRGTSSWTRLPVGTNDQPLVADSGASSGVAYKVLPVTGGGTNSSTALSNNCIMTSQSGAIKEAAALTNGQFLIGSTGAAPVAGTLTGIGDVVILNAAGSASIYSGPYIDEGDGTTTNAYVKLFTFQFSNPNGVPVVFVIKNTHGSNSLTVKVTYDNAFGATNVDVEIVVPPSTVEIINSLAIISGATDPPPYTDLEFRVKSSVIDDHATYESRVMLF